MNFIRLLPVFLSALLLAAHFLRDGQMALVLAILAAPFLLFIRRPWAVRLLQIGLVVGGLEWLQTAYNLIQMRQLTGEAWGRLASILGAVALFTFCSALIFRLQPLRNRYHRPIKQENQAFHEH